MQTTNNQIEEYEDEIYSASVKELCQLRNLIEKTLRNRLTADQTALLNALDLRIQQELRIREIDAALMVGL